ncbi:MAG: hypothetical protein ACTH5C_15805 [Pseudoalteromonas prydzensis]|uniref:hypothetical protein n=1 Tax=Pseudoalteromonas prydzensis TaxID=182141 RepID=UPI003F9E4323
MPKEELKNIIQVFLPIYKNEKLSKEQIVEKITQIEPMASHADLSLKIIEEMEL